MTEDTQYQIYTKKLRLKTNMPPLSSPPIPPSQKKTSVQFGGIFKLFSFFFIYTLYVLITENEMKIIQILILIWFLIFKNNVMELKLDKSVQFWRI